MKPTPSIPWRASLVTRFVLLWSLLLGGLVLLCGWLIWRGGRESLIQTWQENLKHDAAAVQLKVQSAVTDVMRDAAYLSKTPTVREFVRARGTGEPEQWRRLVEDEFHALLEGKPSYFQVRLIGLEEDGKEVIRLDNDGAQIHAMPPERLQKKGDRDYFQETLRLPADSVYVSAINLNQDFGKVSEPHIPTLRAAVKVQGEGGGVFGVLVINVDVSNLLNELEKQPGSAVRLTLAGSRGDYLIHADKTKTFGADLGTPWRMDRDFPVAWQTRAGRPQWLGESEGDLAYALRFMMAPGAPQELCAVLSVPAAEWLSFLKAARDRAALATGIAALLGIAIIVFLSRWLAGRLHRVTAAMAAYEAGQEATGLALQGDDELGQLAATFHDMAAKVRDQVTRLDAARRDAEEATRMKEEFLAVMSHEIRTPMNSVTGLIRVLERNQPAKHQEPVIRSLRIAARNLMALLNDALDYTRLKAGGLDFERSVFSLHQHLADLEMAHRPVTMQKGLSLDVDIDPALPDTVQGDPVRLMQILNNLVTNALKFTDHGHVLIAARRVAERGVEFVVEDTGVGIPESEQARIFAPFTQVRRPDGRQFDGSGLGLSIARELVERQGGTLAVQSRAGEGARFTVVLPLPAAQGADGGPQPAVHAAPDFSGLRVLYIEDVASNRDVMASILEETGARLDFAETGAQAIQGLESAEYDVVLLDLQLPDATGVEVARRILERWPVVPIIAVTAQAGSVTRLECEAAGMKAVVLKPLEPDQLFAVLRTHTAGRDIEPSLEALADIFGSRSEKLGGVLQSLSVEFTRHADALRSAISDGDPAAIRSLRHRMHTAIVQMKLHALNSAMEGLITEDGGVSPDAARHAGCLTAIQSVSAFLARRAGEMRGDR